MNAVMMIAVVVAGTVWGRIMFALGSWVGGRADDWWHRQDQPLRALKDQR